MNIYQEVVDCIESPKTILQYIKALEKLKMVVEDKKLSIGLTNLIKDLVRLYNNTKLKSIPFSLNNGNDSVEAILLYCTGFIKSKTPEWQVEALRNGWRPPR